MVATTIENIKRRQIMPKRRSFINISYDDFIELMKMHSKSFDIEFIIDQENEWLIKELYYYFIGSSKFSKNLESGILVTGNYGTGKSLILNLYCQINNDFVKQKELKRYISIKHSKELALEIFEGTETLKAGRSVLRYYQKRDLFIDELGKEPIEGKTNIGIKVYPIIDLIDLRYHNGGLTFATANFKAESFETIYNKGITERFKEIFNHFELKGKSRRQHALH